MKRLQHAPASGAEPRGASPLRQRIRVRHHQPMGYALPPKRTRSCPECRQEFYFIGLVTSGVVPPHVFACPRCDKRWCESESRLLLSMPLLSMPPVLHFWEPVGPKVQLTTLSFVNWPSTADEIRGAIDALDRERKRLHDACREAELQILN